MPLSNEQWNAPSGGADFYEHQIPNSLRMASIPVVHHSSNGRLIQTFSSVIDSKFALLP